MTALRFSLTDIFLNTLCCILTSLYGFIRSYTVLTVIVLALMIVFVGDSVDIVRSSVVTTLDYIEGALATVYSISLLIKHMVHGCNSFI